jgi:translation initiation factor 1
MRLFEGTPWDVPPRCDRCGALEADCRCPPAPPPEAPRIPPEKQTARLAVEKRAKGKMVTVVRGLPAVGNDLAGLLAALKNSCGAGGSLDGETLEIQGDHRERIRAVLEKQGFRVKGS